MRGGRPRGLLPRRSISAESEDTTDTVFPGQRRYYFSRSHVTFITYLTHMCAQPDTVQR